MPSPLHQFLPSRRLMAALASTALAASLLSATTPASAAPAASAVPAVAVPAVAVSTQQASPVVTPGNFTGLGFDQCQAPTQASMNKWLKHSPYRAAGIYISGDSRACRYQTNLNATWVANQWAKGWKLLPIALGPQASCQPRFPRYADDFRISPARKNGYAKAARQGAAEAAKNAADARAYGIAAGSTIFYDLEGFDLKNTDCRESALVFTSSWVRAIEAQGYVSGFYSSAGSGIKMLDEARRLRAGQFSMPQQIWIADWDGKANTDSIYLAADGWRPGGRMKQYRGGHNETWGGVTINIDTNYLDLRTPAAATPPTAPRPPADPCTSSVVNLGEYKPFKAGTRRVRHVKALQCTLRAKGVYAGQITGNYNKRTRSAVATVKRRWRVRASSTWSRAHWTRLQAEGTPAPLRAGVRGEAVTRAQRALNAAIGAGLPVSSVLDASTVIAVQAYQTRMRLKPTGNVNRNVWRALQAGRR